MTGFTQFRADATYEVDGGWLDTVQVGVRAYGQERRDRSRYLNSRAFINRPITEFGGGLPFPAESDFLEGLGVRVPVACPEPELPTRCSRPSSPRADEIRARVAGSARAPESPWTSSRPAASMKTSTTRTTATRPMPWSRSAGTSGIRRTPAMSGCDMSTTAPARKGKSRKPVDIDYSDPSAPDIILSTPEYVLVGHTYTRLLPSLTSVRSAGVPRRAGFPGQGS